MAKKSEKKITIRLKKSLIGCSEIQRRTVRGLGFHHREERRILENTPAVRGMIKKVIHLIDVVNEK